MPPNHVTVLVSFNRSAFVEPTVRSLLEQTLPPDEIVVLDLGTDDTAARVRRAFGESVEVLTTPGWTLPRVRNVALARTQSDFVALASADTPSAPERLARQVAALEGAPEAGLCHTGAFFVDERGERAALPAERRPAPRGPRSGAGLARSLLLEGNPILGATVMLRRSVVEAVGAFDDTPGLSWDFDLWVRIALASELVHVPEPLVGYRVRTFAIPEDGAGAATERHAATLAKHAGRTAELLGIPASTLARRRRDVLIDAATQHLRAGAHAPARRDLLRALWTARPTPIATALLAATFAPPPVVGLVRTALRRTRRALSAKDPSRTA